MAKRVLMGILKTGKHILVISVAWWNAVLRIRET
jgi:hypothetical protein